MYLLHSEYAYASSLLVDIMKVSLQTAADNLLGSVSFRDRQGRLLREPDGVELFEKTSEALAIAEG